MRYSTFGGLLVLEGSQHVDAAGAVPPEAEYRPVMRTGRLSESHGVDALILAMIVNGELEG